MLDIEIRGGCELSTIGIHGDVTINFMGFHGISWDVILGFYPLVIQRGSGISSLLVEFQMETISKCVILRCAMFTGGKNVKVESNRRHFSTDVVAMSVSDLVFLRQKTWPIEKSPEAPELRYQFIAGVPPARRMSPIRMTILTNPGWREGSPHKKNPTYLQDGAPQIYIYIYIYICI